MSTIDKITTSTKKLPESFQQEVLVFVEFLTNKNSIQEERQNELLWSKFSLSEAMRGLENEDLQYDESDLKERWK